MDIIKDIKRAYRIISLFFGGLILIILIAFVAADIYVKVQYKNELRKMEAGGQPANLSEFTSKTEIPEEQNAANDYFHIFPIINVYPDEWKRIRRVDRLCNDFAEWSEKQQHEMTHLMTKYGNILDIAHKAYLKPSCDFYIDYENIDYCFPAHKFINLSYLLSVGAAIDKAEGRMDKAIERIDDGLGAIKALGTAKYLTAAFAQTICNKIMLDRLENLLVDTELPPQNYQRLYTALKEHRESHEGKLLSGLQSDRCQTIAWNEREWNSHPKMSGGHLKSWYGNISARWNTVYSLRSYRVAIEMAKRPYWERHNTKVFMFGTFITNSAERDARLMTAELAIAVHMYKSKNGDFPASLYELAPDFIEKLPQDPFTGKSFVYRHKEDGFIIYSLGQNLKDDNGECKSPRKSDIVWKYGKWTELQKQPST